MSNVYSIGNNRQLIIYAAGSNIFLRIAHFGGLERPIVLATDYMSHLNECIYNDTLYYTYIATDNSLYVKNIMESKSIYTVNGTDTPSLYHPYIGRCNNSLLLFYLKNNPVTNHTALQCISLSLTNESPDNTPVTLPDCMNNITGYHIYQADNRLILYAAGRIFIIEEIGHIKELKNEEDIRNTVLKECEQRIASLNDSNNSRIEALTDTYQKKLAACQAKIDEQAAVINSITSQYNELMDIACKYRDEALRWRSKLCDNYPPQVCHNYQYYINVSFHLYDTYLA